MFQGFKTKLKELLRSNFSNATLNNIEAIQISAIKEVFSELNRLRGNIASIQGNRILIDMHFLLDIKNIPVKNTTKNKQQYNNFFDGMASIINNINNNSNSTKIHILTNTLNQITNSAFILKDIAKQATPQQQQNILKLQQIVDTIPAWPKYEQPQARTDSYRPNFLRRRAL